MTPSHPDPTSIELEELALDLARGAALEIASTVGAVDVSTKSTSTDLVTQVDRETEVWLVRRLGQLRPDDAVLGEEGGARPGTSDVRWLIDPIDGTVNFVLGIPYYAVSVAAELRGTVVAGAVVNPVTAQAYHARLGGGAWCDNVRLTGPRQVAVHRAVVGTGFGYDAALRRRQVEVLSRLLPLIGDIRRIGSASLELCDVAAGRLDGYFEAGLNPWDYAAGALIAAEAGCVVTGLRGRAPSAELTVAAGGSLARGLCDLLESVDADRVFSRST